MRRRISIFAVALAFAAGMAACGDDESTTVTETTTETTTAAPAETTATAPSSENPSGETADLPLCSESGGVRPCRTVGGGVLEEGGENAGEIADLPLCRDAPPPCRTPGGKLVEP